MKRSPDYYDNKRKLRGLKRTNVSYKANKTEAWKWFHILNEQIFGNLLEPVDKIFISNHKNYGDVYALYYYDDKFRGKPAKISLCKRFDDEKMFVEILAHEMIHQWQWDVYRFDHLDYFGRPMFENSGAHGPSFFAWKNRFADYGLHLKTWYGQKRWFKHQDFTRC